MNWSLETYFIKSAKDLNPVLSQTRPQPRSSKALTGAFARRQPQSGMSARSFRTRTCQKCSRGRGAQETQLGRNRDQTPLGHQRSRTFLRLWKASVTSVCRAPAGLLTRRLNENSKQELARWASSACSSGHTGARVGKSVAQGHTVNEPIFGIQIKFPVTVRHKPFQFTHIRLK